VKEKSALEKELLAEVPKAPVTSDGSVSATQAATAVGGAAVALGGTAAAYAYNKAPVAVTDKLPESVKSSIAQMNGSSSSTVPVVTETPAKDTPAVVKESIAESGQSPEAAANETAVLEKKAVEKELLSEIKPETSTGEPAPKIAEPAATLAAPASPKPIESRDVSPGTVPGSHTQTAPVVTSGVASTTTEKKSTPAAGPSTPSKAVAGSSKTPESPASTTTAEKKKKNRLSFFGKIKEKLSDKKKDKTSS